MIDFGRIFRNKVVQGGFAAAMVIAVPTIVAVEGSSLKAYQDIGGVWTICNGETLDVKPNEVRTQQQCDDNTQKRVAEFMKKVDDLIVPEVKPELLAAHTVFAYNIGMGAYEHSSTLKFTNAGDPATGCQAMLLWYRAGGKDCRQRNSGCYGLYLRRQNEVQLCMKGVANVGTNI